MAPYIETGFAYVGEIYLASFRKSTDAGIEPSALYATMELDFDESAKVIADSVLEYVIEHSSEFDSKLKEFDDVFDTYERTNIYHKEGDVVYASLIIHIYKDGENASVLVNKIVRVEEDYDE